MVNVTNRSNVTVRLIALEFLFGHGLNQPSSVLGFGPNAHPGLTTNGHWSSDQDRPVLCASLSRSFRLREAGAGEGNRTLVFSLEGYCSTIELHPPGLPILSATFAFSAAAAWQKLSRKERRQHKLAKITFRPARYRWWRELDLNQRRHSQRIYSPSPLTARASLQNRLQIPHERQSLHIRDPTDWCRVYVRMSLACQLKFIQKNVQTLAASLQFNLCGDTVTARYCVSQ